MMLMEARILSVVLSENDAAVAAFLVPAGCDDPEAGLMLCTVRKELLMAAPAALLAFQEFAQCASEAAIHQMGMSAHFFDGPAPRGPVQ